MKTPRTHPERPWSRRGEVHADTLRLWEALRDVCANEEAWWIIEQFRRSAVTRAGMTAEDLVILDAPALTPEQDALATEMLSRMRAASRASHPSTEAREGSSSVEPAVAS